jgi:hypothetical protein
MRFWGQQDVKILKIYVHLISVFENNFKRKRNNKKKKRIKKMMSQNVVWEASFNNNNKKKKKKHNKFSNVVWEHYIFISF